MSLVDKKRGIKNELKKIEINDKMDETGYSEFYENVAQYFKLIYQKK